VATYDIVEKRSNKNKIGDGVQADSSGQARLKEAAQ